MDATIIAGMLILLTIKSNELKSIPLKFFGVSYTPYQAAAVVIIWFSLSAINELMKGFAHSNFTNDPNISLGMNLLSVTLPAVGFVYVIIVIVHFALANKQEHTS